MIVRDANVALAGERRYSASTIRRESLRTWIGTRRPDFATGSTGGAFGVEVSDAAEIDGLSGMEATALQRQATALQARLNRPTVTVRQPKWAAAPEVEEGCGEGDEDDGLDTEMRITKWVAEQLLGIKIRVLRVESGESRDTPRPAAQAAEQAAQQSAGWGVEYERSDEYHEVEATNFEAEGWVETEAGEKIAFTVSLQMAREYSAKVEVAIRAGDAARVDPLVINLGNGAAQLTDVRFDFDLDADGDAESVPFVTQGSGVLVFDRNADGVANDGSELFGPTSGDGFAELAALDGDGNGWIDGADRASTRLRVWTKDARGSDHVQTLAQAGVGAIYLGRAQTQFALRDGANNDLGEVVSTGVYLRENGEAGSVQQVNLTA
ncbi:MAG: hypothetical protein ACYC5O_00160 [Anaerolineae bacterium]